MTITIDLPQVTVEQLAAQAAASGKDVDTLVREAVEAKYARRRQTLAEILKPLHDEVDASGIGEKELEALADQAVADARAQRRASGKQP